MKKQKTARIYHWIFLGGLAILLGGGFFMLWSNEKQYQKQLQQYKELEEEHTKARLELEGEKRMLEYAKSDEYIQRMARKMFKWSKDGEIIFQDVISDQITDAQDDPTVASASDQSTN